MWIRPLDDADASCGAKALGLARMRAAGLRVPDGFVLDHHAFREVAALAEVAPDAIGHALAEAGERLAHGTLPAELEREVRIRAAVLGRLAVRSSASLEDGAESAAAGVFASVTDVAPDEVWDAIRAVWTSALTPLAVAYARRREAAIAIAVIVQRFVPGARVTVYTRPLGAPQGDALWIQRGEALQHVPRAAATEPPEAVAALAAEAAIGATAGADVELVTAPGDAAGPWVVQARPMVHPVRRPRRPPPAILLAALVHDGRRWTWDITHNPDPLSPAQAGLVAAVERAACTPYALQVCAGYLYTTPRAAPPPIVPPIVPPIDRAELAARIAAIEARIVLDAAGDDAGALSVAEAVARYVAFMRIWACELSPLVAAARQVLLDRLAREGHPPAARAARAAALIGPRRVLRDPVMAPAWDVAVPTFAERAAGDAPRARSSGPPPVPPADAPAELASAVELARAAADAGETDDLWFARAQWMVRRALRAHGAAQALRGDDVFWLALDELVTPRTFDPDDAQRRASAARAAFARAATWDMPRIVHGDVVDAAPDDTSLRGVGFGARVVGRVVRLASLGAPAAIEPGDIVVTRAITPALAMIVDGCAALVSETGGLLDHGAALARELGIPCVVGCAGAWTQLVDGALIAIDGDAGLVSVM
jgi:phosphohistidine swiveling domain-containing protein